MEPRKVKCTLVGVDGNAFAVMGAWSEAARKEGWTPEEIKAVRDEAMSDDYDHLLATITSYCVNGGLGDGEDE